MRTKLLFVAVLGLIAVMPAAFAASTALKFDDIRSQQAEIRTGVETRTGPYKRLSESDRSLVLRKQNEVLLAIADKQTSDDLSAVQRSEVFNALELIEAVVNKTDDERMVCEHRAPLGSNFKKRMCMTVAQKRAAQERARDELSKSEIQTRR